MKGFIPASLCFCHLEAKDRNDTVSADEPEGVLFRNKPRGQGVILSGSNRCCEEGKQPAHTGPPK